MKWGSKLESFYLKKLLLQMGYSRANRAQAQLIFGDLVALFCCGVGVCTVFYRHGLVCLSFCMNRKSIQSSSECSPLSSWVTRAHWIIWQEWKIWSMIINQSSAVAFWTPMGDFEMTCKTTLSMTIIKRPTVGKPSGKIVLFLPVHSSLRLVEPMPLEVFW